MPDAKPIASSQSDTAPPLLRRIGKGVLALLLLSALYLIAVRREAILTDLANLAAWCF